MARGKKTGGRVAGTPNKATASIKAAMLSVYEGLQAKHENPHGHFLEWAESNPTEFYKLASKLLPLQVTGEDGEAIKHEHSLDLTKLSPETLRELAAQG